MTERIPGIIGGQGPYATFLFLEKLLQYSETGREQDHLHYFLDNNPKLPDRVDAIKGKGRSPVAGFVEMAKTLESCGADFLVMPSNTSHAFYGDIASQVKIPFINMIDVVSDRVARETGGNAIVGILSTSGGLYAQLYQLALQRRGLRSAVPNDDDLERLMGVIHSIKSGDHSAGIVAEARRIANSLVDQGATSIISACTELPLVLGQGEVGAQLVDSLDVLAQYTVNLAKGRVELPIAPAEGRKSAV